MTTYEYECHKCELSHTQTFESAADAQEFAKMWAEEGYKVWQVA
jgi:hypothetical protein